MPFSKAPIEDRQRQVADLLRGHHTAGAIAARLGVTRRTVERDVKALRAQWRERRQIDTDAWVDSELERLAVAERAVWPKVEKGDLWAVDRLLAIMDRRARYLGLDAVQQRDDGNSNSEPAVSITIQPIDYRAVIAPITARPDEYRLTSGQDESAGDGEAMGKDGSWR